MRVVEADRGKWEEEEAGLKRGLTRPNVLLVSVAGTVSGCQQVQVHLLNTGRPRRETPSSLSSPPPLLGSLTSLSHLLLHPQPHTPADHTNQAPVHTVLSRPRGGCKGMRGPGPPSSCSLCISDCQVPAKRQPIWPAERSQAIGAGLSVGSLRRPSTSNPPSIPTTLTLIMPQC